MNYKEIKQNFIDNFINKMFLHSSVSVKKHVFEKMNTYSPFKIIPSEDFNKMQVILGDGIVLDFNIEWTDRQVKDRFNYVFDKVW